MNHLIAPSLLSADFSNLRADFDMINKSEADWLHLDIMDGVFVPNISFGMPVVESAQKYCEKPLDVHLMIVEPDKFIDTFHKLGAHVLNVHYEACTHLHRTIQRIKQLGMKAGVTLNPHTPVSALEEIVSDVDLVMLMSVNPGFGGQKFIEGIVDKTSRLKELIEKKNSNAVIEIDGGVNFETGKRLLAAGADVLVAGSFVFSSENPTETIAKLKRL
ncbi:MAG: ribulose-phosphate 3-epimerase [Paludibacteraceae bacterium]|jgi:ribulose-phosphate 3-epimerase|nr:ribulose-phosphate 3-epimerase [Paludibacteraceae bacterium]MBO5989479.1 ribulose-phosphate 3-epimerase [Paludibacteraceae bacterium]MBQ1970649.1 ribulose-phosphate 3-epimerase [Paludibacteraceae bacterium]